MELLLPHPMGLWQEPLRASPSSSSLQTLTFLLFPP